MYFQIAAHEFIRTILNKLSNPGLAARAQAIFNQVMARGQYRWGRRTELAAGASIVIALRESHKNDSVRDIAVSFNFFLSVPSFPSLSFPRVECMLTWLLCLASSSSTYHLLHSIACSLLSHPCFNCPSPWQIPHRICLPYKLT